MYLRYITYPGIKSVSTSSKSLGSRSNVRATCPAAPRRLCAAASTWTRGRLVARLVHALNHRPIFRKFHLQGHGVTRAAASKQAEYYSCRDVTMRRCLKISTSSCQLDLHEDPRDPQKERNAINAIDRATIQVGKSSALDSLVTVSWLGSIPRSGFNFLCLSTWNNSIFEVHVWNKEKTNDQLQSVWEVLQSEKLWGFISSSNSIKESLNKGTFLITNSCTSSKLRWVLRHEDFESSQRGCPAPQTDRHRGSKQTK